MEVYLYTISCEPNRLDKAPLLPTVSPVSGSIRGSADILRPEIMITGNVFTENYCRIPDFGNRYYFIEDRESVRTGLTRLSLRCDVLTSWAAQIKQCKAVLSRSASSVDAFIPDGMQRQHAFQLSTVKSFSAFTYTSPSIIVLTVG